MRKAAYGWIGAGVGALLAFVGYELKKHRNYENVDIAGCERCHKHIRMRTANSWVRHMIEGHKCSDEQAYDEVEKAWKKMTRGEKA